MSTRYLDSIGYDFETPKKLDIVRVATRMLDRAGRVYLKGPSFPMDADARYAYFSVMDGFVPIEVALQPIFSPDIDYGASGFEGVRLNRTMYGDGFIELMSNLRRLAFSSLAFDLSLVSETILLSDDPNVDHIEHTQRMPREFFADAGRNTDKDIEMEVDIVYKDHSIKHAMVPFRLFGRFSEGDRSIPPKEMEAIMCCLAILNRLPRGRTFPSDEIALIPGGYFRPGFSISGEEGLKVPTAYIKDGKVLFRPKYLKVGTLPWGAYLPEKGYETGLDVLVAPYLRADDAMPVSQKIGGVYVNSARNINTAMILGFGEILALNHNDEVVEGSAENIVVLLTNKRTGKMVAHSPPKSSNILPGTTRDRGMRILDDGLTVEGKKVEHKISALKKSYLVECLEGKTEWEVSSIVMMGTGVGLIHCRSVTDNPALSDWMQLNELRSEGTRPDPIILSKIRETERRYLVNKGVQHPFVAAFKSAFVRLALEGNGYRITPVYDFDHERTEEIFKTSFEEAVGKRKARDFRAKMENGYFKARINGVTHPDEINARTMQTIELITRMNKISQKRKSCRMAAG